MLYFSELKGKKVYTEDQVEVGKLQDLIFLATDKPIVKKIVVEGWLKDKFIIPASFIERLNGTIVIEKEYSTTTLEENELYLVKNLLDKQIIDLKGNKIVRVNDVAIQEKDGLYVAGVDIGILGVMRWLRLESIFLRLLNKFNIKITSQFLSWADLQPLELARGHVKLKKEEQRLKKLRPADLADYLEKTNIVNAKKILTLLDDKFAADVIGNLNINYQTTLLRQFSPEKSAKVLSLIHSDDAVDVLLTFSPKRREKIIDNLSHDKQTEILHLLQLSKTPIGDLVTSDFISVSPDDTAKSVIEKVKKETADFAVLSAIYTLNKENQLVGVFSLHELIVQNPETPVYKFMIQNIIVAHLTTPIEIAIKRFLKYGLLSMPVIDNDKHLLGIITLLELYKFM